MDIIILLLSYNFFCYLPVKQNNFPGISKDIPRYVIDLYGSSMHFDGWYNKANYFSNSRVLSLIPTMLVSSPNINESSRKPYM
jgi:hypothetical protein